MRTRLVPILIAAALGAAACATPSTVPERVTVRKRKIAGWYGDHSVHLKFEYPEVTGLGNPAVQAHINQTIRSAFPPPHGLKEWLESHEGEFSSGTWEDMAGGYDVRLNRRHLLSIKFWGSEGPEGKVIGNHSNPMDAAVTLDTRTGRPFKLSDLFVGPDWRVRLEKLIATYAGSSPGPHKPVPVDQSLLDMLGEHKYWYYLTPRSIRFYDIDSSYAGHALESEIPLEKLRPIVNPKGPLPTLMNKAR